ncbi:MAG: hypothetical protein ACW99A_07315 [Candidatus Kariarchaeaceae archaeon]|jgi:hypothetical protein
MLIYAVYFISTDGRPMLIERFTKDENLPDDILLCGLLGTVQLLAEELTNEPGSAEKFQLKGFVFHLQQFSDKFQVVITSNEDERPAELLDTLGYRFIKKFSDEIENWKGDQSRFLEFGETIIELLRGKYKVDISRSLDPKKRLDTMSILNLPKAVQDTALIVVMLEHATIDEMEKFLNKKSKIIEKHLTELQQMGYIGVELLEDQVYYYVIPD